MRERTSPLALTRQCLIQLQSLAIIQDRVTAGHAWIPRNAWNALRLRRFSATSFAINSTSRRSVAASKPADKGHQAPDRTGSSTDGRARQAPGGDQVTSTLLLVVF